MLFPGEKDVGLALADSHLFTHIFIQQTRKLRLREASNLHNWRVEKSGLELIFRLSSLAREETKRIAGCLVTCTVGGSEERTPVSLSS